MSLTYAEIRILCCASALALLSACGDDDTSSGDGDGTGATDGGTSDDGGTGGTGGGTSDDGDTGATGEDTGGTDGTNTSGGPVPTGECVEDEEVGFEPNPDLDPGQKKDLEGKNGTFTDECDENGNLIEYVCEIRTECSDPPNPDCRYFETGNVETTEFDCDGHCVDGRCEARCPAEGDMVEYLEIDTTVLFRNLTDDRSYSCALVFDQADDTYDCSTDPQVGETVVIIGLGLSSQWCTGGEFGAIATGDPQQCSWSCSIAW